MDNQFFQFKNTSGGLVLPVTDGTLTSPDMSTSYDNTKIFYIEFFSDVDGTVPVTPTAGTISLFGSPMGHVYLAPFSDGVINAADVIPYTPGNIGAYTPPVFYGRMVSGIAVLAGITGALSMRCGLWSFGQ